MTTRLVWCATAALWLVACKKDATGPTGPLTGGWLGSAQGYTVDMNLKETGGTVSGSGSLNTIPVTVSGSDDSSGFSLTLSNSGYQPANLVGVFLSDTLLGGTMYGSGFSAFTIQLARKH